METLLYQSPVLLLLIVTAFSSATEIFPETGCYGEFNYTTCRYILYCRESISYSFEERYHECEDRLKIYGYLYDPLDVIFKRNVDTTYGNEELPPISNSDYLIQRVKSLTLSDNSYINIQLPNLPNLVTLDVSRNSLTVAELSESHEMKFLTDIDFSFNTINTIQVQKDNPFSNLAKLNISHNYLVTVPDAVFDPFTVLETLDISYNFIDTLGIYSFEGIKKLKYLYISHNRLSDINSAFFRFNELRELSISHNRIKHIKASDFEKLSKLVKLDLSSNLISNIDNSLCRHMANLGTVDLSNNKLESVDKDLFLNTSQLFSINLSGNQLKYLPKYLFKNKIISFFSINDNVLSGSLTNGMFDGLKFVLELDISNQQITSIESLAFRGLERVNSLLLNNNNIRFLSDKSFQGLQNLEKIDLSYNEITNIDFSKNDLISLTFLSLKKNYLNKLEHENFLGLNSLQFLDISNNNISKLESNSFYSLRELIHFEISNNPISGRIEESTFTGLNSLPSLDVSCSLLTSVGNNSFIGMNHLKLLNMSRGYLTEIQFNIFLHTGAIELIDFSSNQLTEFNINTTELFNLNTLLLSDNNLKTIEPNMFKGLTQLIKINLSRNKIDTLSTNIFKDQTDLRSFDISYNKNFVFDVILIHNSQHFENLCLSGIKKNILFSEELSVIKVEMSYSNISNITKLNLQNLKFINTLVLSNNIIPKVEVNAFSKLTQLRELDLSFNNISYIQPGSFKDCSRLNSLNISHNLLIALSYGTFRGLLYLNTIDLSYNNIDDLKSERFYEVNSLTTLIADHNRIESVNAEDFYGTKLKSLSIGDNPLPCKSLANLMKSNIDFEIIAIKLDESKENINGVTCNMDGSTFTSPQVAFGKIGDSDKVLLDIRNIMFNISNKEQHNKPYIIHDNYTQYLENVTRLLEINSNDNSNKYSQIRNLTSTVTRILNILSVMNAKKSTPVILPRENITVENILPIINKFKQDLEDTMAGEKHNILNQLEAEIKLINSRIDSLKSSVPTHEKLVSSNVDESRAPLFTEICVGIILIIMVCFILYKFYKSRMFVPRRRSFSTAQIAESIENSHL